MRTFPQGVTVVTAHGDDGPRGITVSSFTSVSFPLEFRSEHDFVFTLPLGDVHTRGVVRHCEAWAEAKGPAIFLLGVEFTDLSGDARERVVAYLEEQIQSS